MDLNEILETAIPYTKWQIFDIVFAIIILIIAFIIARILVTVFKRALKHTKLPDLAANFLVQLVTSLFYVAVLLTFLSALGITVSSVILGISAVIGLMSTELVTSDNVFIMIPNKMVWNSAIINMTHLPTRRFDLTMTFNLVGDIDSTIKAILDQLKKNPEILREPEPKIYILNITPETADLQIRAWVNTENYDGIATVIKENLLREFSA